LSPKKKRKRGDEDLTQADTQEHISSKRLSISNRRRHQLRIIRFSLTIVINLLQQDLASASPLKSFRSIIDIFQELSRSLGGALPNHEDFEIYREVLSNLVNFVLSMFPRLEHDDASMITGLNTLVIIADIDHRAVSSIERNSPFISILHFFHNISKQRDVDLLAQAVYQVIAKIIIIQKDLRNLESFLINLFDCLPDDIDLSFTLINIFQANLIEESLIDAMSTIPLTEISNTWKIFTVNENLSENRKILSLVLVILLSKVHRRLVNVSYAISSNLSEKVDLFASFGTILCMILGSRLPHQSSAMMKIQHDCLASIAQLGTAIIADFPEQFLVTSHLPRHASLLSSTSELSKLLHTYLDQLSASDSSTNPSEVITSQLHAVLMILEFEIHIETLLHHRYLNGGTEILELKSAIELKNFGKFLSHHLADSLLDRVIEILDVLFRYRAIWMDLQVFSFDQVQAYLRFYLLHSTEVMLLSFVALMNLDRDASCSAIVTSLFWSELEKFDNLSKRKSTRVKGTANHELVDSNFMNRIVRVIPESELFRGASTSTLVTRQSLMLSYLDSLMRNNNANDAIIIEKLSRALIVALKRMVFSYPMKSSPIVFNFIRAQLVSSTRPGSSSRALCELTNLLIDQTDDQFLLEILTFSVNESIPETQASCTLDIISDKGNHHRRQNLAALVNRSLRLPSQQIVEATLISSIRTMIASSDDHWELSHWLRLYVHLASSDHHDDKAFMNLLAEHICLSVQEPAIDIDGSLALLSTCLHTLSALKPSYQLTASTLSAFNSYIFNHMSELSQLSTSASFSSALHYILQFSMPEHVAQLLARFLELSHHPTSIFQPSCVLFQQLSVYLMTDARMIAYDYHLGCIRLSNSILRQLASTVMSSAFTSNSNREDIFRQYYAMNHEVLEMLHHQLSSPDVLVEHQLSHEIISELYSCNLTTFYSVLPSALRCTNNDLELAIANNLELFVNILIVRNFLLQSSISSVLQILRLLLPVIATSSSNVAKVHDAIIPRIFMSIAKIKSLGNHLELIICSLVDILSSSFYRSGGEVPEGIKHGLYQLLDVCEAKQRKRIHQIISSLPQPAAHDFYRQLTSQYNEEYKFIGKA
jgi:hypothetical protein